MLTEKKTPKDSSPVMHRFSTWCMSRFSPYVYMITVSMVVGVACGGAAWLLKFLLATIGGIFLPHIEEGTVNWWLPAVPVAGILLTGIICRYIIHDYPTHGTARIINALNARHYRLGGALVYTPILTSSVTLGMGGTSGSEGPIAYAGAAIGSNIGKWLGLDGIRLRTLIGCGASAGIAGIFIAPVGGVLFGLEVLRIRLTSSNVIAVATACMTSFFTVALLHGYEPDLHFVSSFPASEAGMLPVALLGVFCGLYSLYYSGVIKGMDTFFKSISNPWISNLAGGIIVGMCLLLFPSMYGIGYPVIESVINGQASALSEGSVSSFLAGGDTVLIMSCVGILLLKCWGVTATNSSGGVGGDFAPTLFAGCVAGYLFGAVAGRFVGTDLPLTVFAFLGMAGVMSAAIEAPLMAIFIVLEMTRSFDYGVPVMIVALVSYVTLRVGKYIVHSEGRMIRHFSWFHRK